MIRLFAFLALISLNTIAFAVDMNNVLTHKGEGGANPDYGKKIKNLMIFHPTSAKWWYEQVPERPDEVWSSTWPLNWGKGPATYSSPSDQGYMFRNKDVYLKQMEEIQGLGGHTAVAAFLIPNDEAGWGYGSYWTPTGQWKRPMELYDEVRWAAWQKGVQVAPFLSFNDYLKKGPESILPELKKMVDFVMQRVDAVSVKTTDGKVVILIEGLPPVNGLEDRPDLIAQINQYLASRTDILWIDNLANSCPTAAPNIYRSAAVSDMSGTIQESLKNICGGRYLWHFTNRHVPRTNKTPSGLEYIPMDVQQRWLNIVPHDPNMYPVIISQWNEYSEWKMFEPSEYDGDSEYNYLKWRMTQQP